MQFSTGIARMVVVRKKAVDSLEHNVVIEALMGAGIDPECGRTVQVCYAEAMTIVKLFEREIAAG
ncbi:hypothetical protein OESDEN_06168 [Oesophagostomum dentatum]|uniref:Uncharacterized protein n=1 Tax=Oesophagostomum dentatum TaxID=61180 RepID=A0A0B1TEU4_OESDE|nr:hypothetical protein OESDEN_06168 [Oesophagostomum dentatum]